MTQFENRYAICANVSKLHVSVHTAWDTHNTHIHTYRYIVFYCNYMNIFRGSVEWSTQYEETVYSLTPFVWIWEGGGLGKVSTFSSKYPADITHFCDMQRMNRRGDFSFWRYNKMCIRPLNLLWTSYNMFWDRNSLHAEKLNALKTSQTHAIFNKARRLLHDADTILAGEESEFILNEKCT
jgi:hypothetical protein